MKIIIRITILITIFLIAILVISCSSTKNAINQKEAIEKKEYNSEITSPSQIINYRKQIDSYECLGDFELNFNNQSFDGTFELQTIRNKIFLLKLFGPFGINIASIFGENDKVTIINSWNNIYYQSKNGFDGFEFLTPYPEKFFKIFLAESFLESDTLNNPKSDTVQISKNLNKSYLYNLLYSIQTNSVLSSKIIENQYEYDVYYDKFEKNNFTTLPKNIVLKENRMNGKIKLSVDKFKNINNIFKIQTPNYVKLKKVENLNQLFNNNNE
jgi:hypothetical protein